MPSSTASPSASASASTSASTSAPQALAGLKVLELGQLIAGPFAAKTLADFGARVVKVEAPGAGDPLRQWRLRVDGTSVWWSAQSRNKESVCLDLRQPEGQEIVRRLAADADVLIENFRPGTLEGWGLGWDVLHALNPRLVMLRLSGFGQTGPRAQEPGFAAVAESFGGLRYLMAEPGGNPVRAGVSIGDTVAGLHGCLGILLALYHRDARGGEGQMIDLALYEGVMNLTESLLPEFDALGVVRRPAGGALPGITPSNAYRCADGEHVIVAGNGDGIFRRLMSAIGRDDLARDPGLADNAGRSARAAEIDGVLQAWAGARGVDEALVALKAAGVPGDRVYAIDQLARDAHWLARGNVERIPMMNGGTVAATGIVPRLSATPGAVHDAAPTLGQHTDAVLRELGLGADEIAALRAKGAVA